MATFPGSDETQPIALPRLQKDLWTALENAAKGLRNRKRRHSAERPVGQSMGGVTAHAAALCLLLGSVGLGDSSRAQQRPAAAAAAAGVPELARHDMNSSALAAENQHLRSEVRLLRQLLAGAGSRGALGPRQAEAEVPTAAKPQRRTLQDLLPPRSSPFRKYLFLNESIFDGAPSHARTMFNPPTNLGAVIRPDQPWEAGIYPFAQVIQFGNEIRVYYHCQGDTPLGTFLVPMLCLATSTDGRSFVKPDLGNNTKFII